MRLKNEEYEDREEEETDQEQVDNSLELLKYATKVLSRNVRKDITPDFVMAKFNLQKDKEAIIEITNNAYFTKRTLRMLLKSRTWRYNYAQERWERIQIGERAQKEIIEATDRMFDTFLTRMTMTAILNRNVKNNHILRLIAHMDTEEDEMPAQEEEEQTKIQELLERLKGKKKGEAEEWR